ncbi:hypothetical protein [Geoalkalibacter halelectricus]|uniref:hypothetical protein n=1 Tax=Geoalkalibacter halelectricus TaxID=2847045 RepID=UPI0026701A28|nr:hypothetical protein [Geoalkalibacter halelectricus]MDO3380349.1 hypothetical protein [Geoalkalibacter halelectricus]
MKKAAIKTALCAGVLAVALASTVSAKNLGVVGTTYDIAEPDALQEIMERVEKHDWDKEFASIKPEAYRPPGLRELPRAQRTRSFLVDMTYTLDRDIPDGRGGILYPKGFTFNPLDHVFFDQALVIFDGDDPEQVAWVKEQGYLDKPGVLLLLSQGDYVAVGKQLQRAVQYADARIVDRFQLKAVPSVVAKQGRYMEVVEYEVPRNAG